MASAVAPEGADGQAVRPLTSGRGTLKALAAVALIAGFTGACYALFSAGASAGAGQDVPGDTGVTDDPYMATVMKWAGTRNASAVTVMGSGEEFESHAGAPIEGTIFFGGPFVLAFRFKLNELHHWECWHQMLQIGDTWTEAHPENDELVSLFVTMDFPPRLLLRGMMQTTPEGAWAPMLNCFGAEALENGVDYDIRIKVTSNATNTTSVLSVFSVDGEPTNLGAVCTFPNVLKSPDREHPRNVWASWNGHCSAPCSFLDGKIYYLSGPFDGR
jgi:hypothetical protein